MFHISNGINNENSPPICSIPHPTPLFSSLIPMERRECWTRGPTIGRGSTAAVSLATAADGRLFAVKSAELGRSLFLQREETILSTLSSPHVVACLGSCVTHDDAGRATFNILMDYVPGGTLADAVRRRGGKGMDEAEIRDVTSAVLQGMAYVHGRRIVHCDVKAENILMGGDGPLLADFGCAKLVEDGPPAAIAGTPSHMSPEAARGEAQGMPADVWALGCTVIEMANGGGSPWPHSGDAVAALYRIGFSSAAAPEVPRWLSAPARDFLAKCLDRDPVRRWTVAELMKHPFVDGLSGKRDRLVTSDSPTSVLDSDFWSSVEEDERPLGSTDEQAMVSVSIPAMTAFDRIGRVSSRSSPDWRWDEDWINVRCFSLVEEEGPSDALEGTHILVENGEGEDLHNPNSIDASTNSTWCDEGRSGGYSIEKVGSFQLKEATPGCTSRASFVDRFSNLGCSWKHIIDTCQCDLLHS